MQDESTAERSAMRKASWRLLPLIGLAYGIAYMDRINISFAAQQMNAQLGFDAAVYGLGAGLFFVSYAFFEVPSNLLLLRFGVRRWIARIMLTWGLLAMAMMLVRTPWQFYAVRFLLGFAEAGFFPGVIVYVTRWFPLAHRARAVSRFYVAIPFSQIVMGSVAGALLGLDGRFGLRGWQWLFLIEGLPAVLVGVLVFFGLPERPEAVSWLSDAEKGWIARSLATDDTRHPPETGVAILRALRNPVVLGLGAMQFLTLGGFYAFNLSAPQVLQELTGLDITRVGFLVALSGVLGIGTLLGNAWAADRTRRYVWHTAAPLLIAAAAFALIAAGATPAMAMAAYLTIFAMAMAQTAVFWPIPTGLLPPSQIAVGVAAINTIGQVGSFVAPYAWGLLRKQTQTFYAGIWMVAAEWLGGALVVLLVGALAARPKAMATT
jgi:ACS family tartrate transporter-like MFS transporter